MRPPWVSTNESHTTWSAQLARGGGCERRSAGTTRRGGPRALGGVDVVDRARASRGAGPARGRSRRSRRPRPSSCTAPRWWWSPCSGTRRGRPTRCRRARPRGTRRAAARRRRGSRTRAGPTCRPARGTAGSRRCASAPNHVRDGTSRRRPSRSHVQRWHGHRSSIRPVAGALAEGVAAVAAHVLERAQLAVVAAHDDHRVRARRRTRSSRPRSRTWSTRARDLPHPRPQPLDLERRELR